MKRTALALLGAGLLALGVGACGDNGTRTDNSPTGPQPSSPPDDNGILRGDVGDFVWCDMNDNGAQDDGPTSGVNNVSVVIECDTDTGGTFMMSFVTQNSPVTGEPGWYNFNAVPAGSCMAYVDTATIPADKHLSDKACGGPLYFRIGSGTSGNNNKNIDFCLVQNAPIPGQIGDFVWCDLNDDGVQDPGEPGVPGVVVNLSCADGSSASTVTDASGYYLFTDVTPNVLCTVSVDPTSFPADKEPGTNCPTSRDVTLAEGQIDLDEDFCLIEIPPTGGEGCTPGYWKNHPNAWPGGYNQLQSVGSVFSDASLYPALASSTLREALAFPGGTGTVGAARILLRAAVAALLNAASPDVDYPTTEADVIMEVNTALASQDRATMLALATTLDQDNNLGCPLN